MSSVIDAAWNALYEANPKIQALAVWKENEIIWQTQNWNLVDISEELIKAPEISAQSVTISGVVYHMIASTTEAYLASAKGDKGHFIMAKTANSIWLMAWLKSDAVPELALIDLTYAALNLGI